MLWDSTANASSSLGLPIICKKIPCMVGPVCQYMGLILGNRGKFVVKKTCAECGLGLMDSKEFARQDAIYDITSALIQTAGSCEILAANFASLVVDLNSLGEAYCHFDSQLEHAIIARSAELWVPKTPIDKVRHDIVNEVLIEPQERGLCLCYEYLRLGFFKTISGGLVHKAAGIFSLVILRDRESILERTNESFNPNDISLCALQYYLNKSYFTPHNPLHEIQWVVAGLLAKLTPRSADRNLDSLIRLAVFLLWTHREGITNPSLAICTEHGDIQMKPQLAAI